MLKLSLLIDKLIWFFTLILFCSFYIFDTSSYNRFILLGITGCILALEILRYGKSISLYWHSFHTYVFTFTLFCFLSYIWSINPTETLVKTITILQLLICMSVLYIYFIKQKSVIPLLDIIMWGGYIITIYAFWVYGIDTIKSIIVSSGRLGDSFNNVNSIGILVAFSTIITIYKILFYKLKWYHLLVISNIIMIAACGSRKALVLFVLGSGAIVFLRYSSKNWMVSAVKYILVGIVLLFLFKLLLTLQIFDGVNKRMETLLNMYSGYGNVDNSTILRSIMIHVGWQQFLQTPFLGTGIGSAGDLLLVIVGMSTYFHNNYIELLATGGLIGTLLYYSMLFVPAFKLFTQRNFGDENVYLCLIFIFLLLIMDWGSVSYYTKQTYFYIMMFFIQVQINNRCLRERANGQAQKSY